jgi:ArsR family transcriptional regulator, virulence genes transcriptional regulator
LSLRHAANLLQALAHPIRLQILDVVREAPCTVGQIVGRLGLAQPVVSRHLAVLRHEGVLSVAPSGRERVYRLAGCRVEPLLGVLFDSPQRKGTAA